MPIRASGFDEEIERMVEEVQITTRRIGFAWYQAIISGTPVDTGQHRNNWHMDFGGVSARFDGSTAPSRRDKPLSQLPPLDGTSNARLGAIAKQLETWKIDSGNIFIHNSGPAIFKLDSGEGSAQAKQGILDPATAAVRAEFGLS